MKILLSNDDGIDAIGIRELLKALTPIHEVSVCAPMTQQSAVSRALTLYSPLRAQKRVIAGFEDIEAWAVGGTPVDCIRLGLGNLCSTMPELVISGINIGQNMGTDTLYSGTCAAALEAAVRHIPAIAMSCCSFDPKHMDVAARIAVLMADYTIKNPLPFGAFYNVNVPDVPFEQLKGIRQTNLGVIEYEKEYICRQDGIGKDYYWAPRVKLAQAGPRDTDERWNAENWVTVTPLSFNNAVPNISMAGLDGLLQ